MFAIIGIRIGFGAVLSRIKETFEKYDHIVFWIATVILMCMSHYHWSYHDTSLWDSLTMKYVEKTWGDWHWLKMLMKFEYSLCMMVFGVLCWQTKRKYLWVYAVSILALHWGSFEFFMNFAMLSRTYSTHLFEDWFRLHWTVALLISIIGIAGPFFFVRPDEN